MLMFPIFVMVSLARPNCTATVIPEQSSGLHLQRNTNVLHYTHSGLHLPLFEQFQQRTQSHLQPQELHGDPHVQWQNELS